MHATLPLLEISDFPAIRREKLDTLQVNLGYRCNQSCVHCHVNAGPHRTEMMDDATLAQVVNVLQTKKIKTLDLTGGAPEMHPGFQQLVSSAVALGVHVIDRCNLTILLEPGYDNLPLFLADHHVEIVASLPCYSAANVNQQRGNAVFEKSISALQLLNALGYGKPDSGLILNLVYNPQGPNLPPDQRLLENDYKVALASEFGIVFNHLFTITNMPIKRFGSMLVSQNRFDEYMTLLKNSYSATHLDKLMCRYQLSVDWQGYLYDCDFNQQLELALPSLTGKHTQHRPHLEDLLSHDAGINHAGVDDVSGMPIKVADHCYGCTAGQGSSCGGSL